MLKLIKLNGVTDIEVALRCAGAGGAKCEGRSAAELLLSDQ